MKKSSLTMTAAAFLGLCSSTVIADTVKLDVQSAWPLTLPASGQNAEHMTERLNDVSNGDIRIKLYSSGELVPSLQIFDAVQQGTLDAGYTSPLYVAGRFPEVALFGGVPFGPDAMTYLGWIYNGGGLELWREIYAAQGVVNVPCGLMDSEAGGWYKFEINSPEDLKGKKVRFAGLAGEVMKDMGASVVLLGGGDIYPNLERGVIDGTEFSMPAIDASMGFEQVAEYYYLPGWHQPAAFNELIVNKKKWDGMSDSQRSLIEDVCRETHVWSMTSTLQSNAEAIQKFTAAGTQIKSFSPEMMDAFKEATDKVMAQQSADNPNFAKVYDSLQAYRESVADWSERR